MSLASHNWFFLETGVYDIIMVNIAKGGLIWRMYANGLCYRF